MKKTFVTVILIMLSFPSYGKDFLFVLKCLYEDKRSSPNPFYFIGREKGNPSQIIFLKSDGRIFSYKGGESKNLVMDKESMEFFEYTFYQKKTPNFDEYISKFTLDRSSLRLGETIDPNSKKPIYIEYACSRELNEQKSYTDAMALKSKYDSGGHNKI